MIKIDKNCILQILKNYKYPFKYLDKDFYFTDKGHDFIFHTALPMKALALALSLTTISCISQTTSKLPCATEEQFKKIFENYGSPVSFDKPDSLKGKPFAPLRDECWSKENKAQLVAYLKGEYDFKKELEERKISMRVLFEKDATRIIKKDTTKKYQIVLDSLFKTELDKSLLKYKNYKRNSAYAYFIGTNWLYSLLPELRAALKDSLKYDRPESIKMALARLGDSTYYRYYTQSIEICKPTVRGFSF